MYWHLALCHTSPFIQQEKFLMIKCVDKTAYSVLERKIS